MGRRRPRRRLLKGTEKHMIRLTRLNKEQFYLNCELIEFVEETPDTIISMMSGRKLVVSETAEQVRELIIEYKRRILKGAAVRPPSVPEKKS